MMPFYNTIGATGHDLAARQAATETQAQRILRFFQDHPRPIGWTPSEVHREALPASPLTSVRRAMTDLTNEGALVKTEIMRPGAYGCPEHVWKLFRGNDHE